VKLLVFVIENTRADEAVDAMTAAGLRVTKLASTGGWLRRGNTTLLVGLEEHDIAQAQELVRKVAGGALAFTLPLERFERL
jgi:uncharacterized protein YaaQ